MPERIHKRTRSKHLMNITGKTILITGTNRGLGKALVEEALRRGAKRVYAGARVPMEHSDMRVTPLTLDITNAAQIQEAVEKVESLDILVNNASIALSDDVSDRRSSRRHLLRHIRHDPGLPAAAHSFSGSHRQCPIRGSPGRLAGRSALLNRKGSRVQPDPITSRFVGWTGRKRSCRPTRTYRYRDVPISGHTEGLSKVRRASCLRRDGEGRGRNLSRPHV